MNRIPTLYSMALKCNAHTHQVAYSCACATRRGDVTFWANISNNWHVTTDIGWQNQESPWRVSMSSGTRYFWPGRKVTTRAQLFQLWQHSHKTTWQAFVISHRKGLRNNQLNESAMMANPAVVNKSPWRFVRDLANRQRIESYIQATTANKGTVSCFVRQDFPDQIRIMSVHTLQQESSDSASENPSHSARAR